MIERIRELAIPPAWKDVWICPYPMGHIQAVGIDAAGRKQYRYHQRWRERRDQQKFDEMIDFAGALPGMRERVAAALAADDSLSRERVLACATRLLDRGFFRVGGEDYAVENETYGLATLEKRHVQVDGDQITFDYLAKSGKRRASKTARKRAITRCVEEVARYLGNTPAVCRASYIDPRVFDRFAGGLTIGGVIETFGEAPGGGDPQAVIEQAVLDLICGHESSDAVEPADQLMAD